MDNFMSKVGIGVVNMEVVGIVVLQDATTGYHELDFWSRNLYPYIANRFWICEKMFV